MGVSTDGIIAFGVPCIDDAALPWDAEPFCGDMNEWWRSVNGFVDVHQPFDEHGNYAEGWSGDDPRLAEYTAAREAFDKRTPLPVSVEDCCSASCPKYAIVLPETVVRCYRGFPATFNPDSLIASFFRDQRLREFIRQYGIETEGEPRWLLMSYWGA
jgi:hypothetical protein